MGDAVGVNVTAGFYGEAASAALEFSAKDANQLLWFARSDVATRPSLLHARQLRHLKIAKPEIRRGIMPLNREHPGLQP
jgi:hypothetical protein